ncbi:MAG: tetratricopeptide repeat protein, partial [Candidatus Omnitrophica bacterium]|nr:tetratricopeptide repeat protein [Candidatus Omnitrophota bacterium]
TIPSIVMHYTYNGAMTILPVVMLMFSNPSYFEYQVNYFQIDGQQKETLLRKTIQQHPDFFDAYHDLAELYAQEKRNLEEALDLINRGLEVYPDRYMFLNTKAEVLYQLGRYDEAQRVIRGLLERYPDDPNLKKWLARLRP